MRRDPLFAALTLSLILCSTTAFAQGMGGGPMGPGAGIGGPAMMGGQGMMGPGRFLVDPATLPALKQKLGITAEQDNQWKGYADAVAGAWDTRQGMRQSAGAAMTPEELAQVRDTHRQAMQQIHAQVLGARDTLYAVLSPDQRRILDASAPARPMAAPPR